MPLLLVLIPGLLAWKGCHFGNDRVPLGHDSVGAAGTDAKGKGSSAEGGSDGSGVDTGEGVDIGVAVGFLELHWQSADDETQPPRVLPVASAGATGK